MDRSVVVRLSLDASGFNRGTAAAASASDALAKKIQGGNVEATSAMQKLQNRAASLTRTLGLLGAGYLALNAVKSTITLGNDFTKSLNTLGAVSGATAAQLSQVSDVARKLGADNSLAATSSVDAAQAMTELAKGGLSVTQSMQAARGTLQLAAAAQVDAATAANIQVNALNAFGLSASSAAHVADVLANTANAASGEITDFALGMSQVATVANQFGINIDDTSAALGLFANAGIKGSDAGTSLKNMLIQLASPSKQQAAALDELGVKAFDAQGNFVGLSALSDQLAGASKRMTTEQFNAAAATAFGTDAVRAAGVFARNGAQGFDAMAASVGKAGGASKLAAAQMKGLPGAWEAFKNQVQDVQLDIYEAIAPGLEKSIRGLSVDLPKAWDAAKQAATSFFIGLHGADYETTLNAPMQGLVKFGQTVRQVIDQLKPAFAQIGGFIAAVIPSLLQLVAAGAPLAQLFGVGVIGAIKLFGSTLQGILPAVQALIGLATDVVSALGPFATVAAPAVLALFLAFKGYSVVKAATSKIIEWSGTISSKVTDATKTVTSKLDSAALSAGRFTGAVTGSSKAALGAQKGISGVSTVAGKVGPALAKAGAALPALGIGFAIFGAAAEAGQQKMQAVADEGAKLAQAFLDGGQAAITAAAQIASAQSVVDSVKKTGLTGDNFKEAGKAAVEVGAYKQALDEWNKTATVAEKQQQAVTAATNNYQLAVQKFGAGSTQAAGAANTLALAQASLKASQEGVAQATQTATDKLVAQANAAIGLSGSAVALASAELGVQQAQQSAADATATYGAKSLEAQQANLGLTQSMQTAATAAGQKAAAQLTDATESEKSTASSKAYLAELLKLKDEAGGKVPAAINSLIASLQGSAGQMGATGAAATILKGKVLDIPNERTVHTSALTASAIAQLRALGLKVTTLPDGTVTVEADTGPAAAELASITKDRTVHITYVATGPAAGIYQNGKQVGNAAGGRIFGPGTGTSDSIPAMLSNREFVLKASSAIQLDNLFPGFLDRLNTQPMRALAGIAFRAAGGHVSQPSRASSLGARTMATNVTVSIPDTVRIEGVVDMGDGVSGQLTGVLSGLASTLQYGRVGSA